MKYKIILLVAIFSCSGYVLLSNQKVKQSDGNISCPVAKEKCLIKTTQVKEYDFSPLQSLISTIY